MEINYITSNKRKLGEMKYFFGDSLNSTALDLIEVQGTAEYICRHKIEEARRQTGLDTIVVDDISLELEGLHGFPGPYFKDFLKVGNKKIVDIISRIGNKYKVVCNMGLYFKGEINIFTGIVEGTIRQNENVEDNNPFGILFPNGSTVDYYSLKGEELLGMSARLKAAQQLKDFINKQRVI